MMMRPAVKRSMAMLTGAALLGMNAGSLAAASNQTVYFYLDRHDRWCATGDVNRYHRAADAEGEARLNSDEGLVDYVRGKPVRIEASQANVEAEVSLSERYQLDPAGRVTSAKFLVTTIEDPDAPTRRTYFYTVAGGTYHAQSAQGAAALTTFRKITSIGTMPVAALLEKARVQPRGGPFCRKPAGP